MSYPFRRCPVACVSLALLSWLVPSVGAQDERPRIDADFPGGNIILEKIEGDKVYLHQDLRDTAGDWFYWHFRVRGAGGRSLTFLFTRGNPIGVRGPSVSVDAGKTWSWLGAQSVRGAGFDFTFPKDAADVRFCFAFPYVGANLDAFLSRHAKHPHLKVESLGKTKKGRDIPLLGAGRMDGEETHRIALTCRHHACEMMASFVLEGIVEETLGDSEDGRWLREHVAFFIVPMVDRDGVEDGDQGKNRKPHDPNRDYQGESLYPAVAAIRKRLPAWADGKLRIAMDMHCPAKSGGNNETVFFVGGPDEKNWNEIVRFSANLEKVRKGPLPFSARNNMPFGQGWNSKSNYSRTPFAHWAAEIPGVVLATTIEVAYANAGGVPVTDASARRLLGCGDGQAGVLDHERPHAGSRPGPGDAPVPATVKGLASTCRSCAGVSPPTPPCPVEVAHRAAAGSRSDAPWRRHANLPT